MLGKPAINDLSTLTGVPDVLIQEAMSPASHDRTIVMVALRQDSSVDAFASVFLDRSQTRDMTGPVSMLIGSKLPVLSRGWSALPHRRSHALRSPAYLVWRVVPAAPAGSHAAHATHRPMDIRMDGASSARAPQTWRVDRLHIATTKSAVGVPFTVAAITCTRSSFWG